ncbi:hypothetical protein M9H77_10546 [Catharanthus roseus]|uniref:Uncharacterized protein n=1 Tax=Catharanthus roseus TaxID=4058 RepID=A0ACC0BC54_CATRO|nr:hypothetical protein M9H77_10546 [Catharanthus roseus]
MDEGMEELVGEYWEQSKIDLDYEFDASQYYDFTTDESNSEAGEVERWFEIAGSYPPSPLVLKYLGKSTSSGTNDAKSPKSSSKQVDSQSTKNRNATEENTKAKKQSARKQSKQRSSTLMKPTASHLAKLNKASHIYSNYLCGRSHKPSTPMSERSVHSSHGFDIAATKRQKLDIGFLRKVAQLKHQNSLLHKTSKKGGRASGNVATFKTKVTVPKEPELETQQRAQNRRNNAEAREHAKPRTGTQKARPLNKQMFQDPSLVPPKKSTRQLPEFKVFHLKTMERAMQHASLNDRNSKNSVSASQCGAADLKSSKSHHGLKNKIKPRSLNSKIFPTKEDMGGTKDINDATISMESKLSKSESLSQNPPTELFNKLSLIADPEETVSQPKAHQLTKVSKENAADSFQPEFWKCVGKPNQCGNGTGIPGIANQPNMNRSLGIR